MGRKPEDRLWDRTRTNIGAKVRLERIENMLGSGTPDVLAIGSSRVTWIENKIADWPVHAETRIQFLHPPTIHQRNWHLMWKQNGGHSIFLVGNGDGSSAKVFAVGARFADEIIGFKRSMLERFETNWGELAAALHGKIKKYGEPK